MFQTLIAIIALASVAVSGWIIPKLEQARTDIQQVSQQVSEQSLGAQNAVGGERYFLSGSGVSSSATSLGLTKFGYTQPNGTYAKFTMTNFGDLGCITIQPGNASGKQEFASFTGITQNADGTATLTGATRGLERYSPYIASTTLQTAHAGGSEVVVSNSPPCFYEGYANAKNTQNITGAWGFAIDPYSYGTATSTAQYATRAYANALAIQGAATSTTNTSGIGLLATGAQAAAGTYKLTEPYFLSTLISTSTYFGNGNNKIITTKTNGSQANTIDPNFIATSSSYTWSASTTFSGSPFTISGATTTILSATTTMSGILGIASTTPTLKYAGDISVSGDAYIAGGLGVGVATTSNTNLVVGGLATTTNLIVSGSSTFGSWEIKNASGNLDGGSPSSITITVDCTAGKKIVGGGVNGIAWGIGAGIIDAYPSDNDTWTATVQGNNGASDSITAYAICI